MEYGATMRFKIEKDRLKMEQGASTTFKIGKDIKNGVGRYYSFQKQRESSQRKKRGKWHAVMRPLILCIAELTSIAYRKRIHVIPVIKIHVVSLLTVLQERRTITWMSRLTTTPSFTFEQCCLQSMVTYCTSGVFGASQNRVATVNIRHSILIF